MWDTRSFDNRMANDLGGKTLSTHDSNTILQHGQKGRPARPQRVKARGVPSGYVEGLNDARTKLADFFTLLLNPFDSDG